MARQERIPAMSDEETRVYAKIVEDLRELDALSQRHVVLNLKDSLVEGQPRSWPIFVLPR